LHVEVGARALALLCLLVLGSACRAPLSVRAAESGDWAGLRAAITRERGSLDESRLRELAHAVAEREIRTARGEQGRARIEDAGGCGRAVADSLHERAKGSGDEAAQAQLALFEARPAGSSEGQSLWARHGEDPNPLWRAATARAQLGPSRGLWRRKFYVDPDERVRLAALRAALDVSDPADVGLLLETARLDPNPLGRALAARAAGGIASSQVVVGLRDIYVTADEGLRQSIIDGWARSGAASAGGLREIEQVATNQRGASAIEAASRLLPLGGKQAALGTQALLRAMHEGLPRDRVLAINNAPLDDPAVVRALGDLEHAPDKTIRATALARQLDVAGTRAKAEASLKPLAQEGVVVALFALARARDPWALDGLERDASSSRGADVRLAAARALVDAGEAKRGAELLGDNDPRVRMRFACAILSKESHVEH
jgi:hypothetical protein